MTMLYVHLYPLLWIVGVEILFRLALTSPGALLLPMGYGDKRGIMLASQFVGNMSHIFLW